MRRRQFLGAAGAALTPFAVWAQQPKAARVAFLTLANPELFFGFLTDGLREEGYVAGKNLQLDLRVAEGKADVLARQAAELARARPDVIVAVQTPAAQAAMKATVELSHGAFGDALCNGASHRSRNLCDSPSALHSAARRAGVPRKLTMTAQMAMQDC